MKQTSSATIRYRFGHADTDTADIRYRFNQLVPQVVGADIVYRFSRDEEIVRCGKQAGCWAWSTQELGNMFPHWHMARHNPGGNTQMFMNSWAINVDEMKKIFATFRKDLFISTADATEPHNFYYAPVVDYGSRITERTGNLLANSGFSLKTLARLRTPAHWYGHNIVLAETPTFAGTHSVRLDAIAGDNAYLRQRLVREIPISEHLTASIWYLVPMPEGHISQDEFLASLAMHIVYLDGTMETVRTPLLLGTNGVWRRAQVSVQLAKEMFAVTFSVHIGNTTAEPIRIYVGAAQLELGKTATQWIETTSGSIPYLEGTPRYESPIRAFVSIDGNDITEEFVAGSPVTYSGDKCRWLTYVTKSTDFWNELVPSRSTTTVQTTVPAASSRTRLGWFTTPSDAPEVYSTGWDIRSNKLTQYNVNSSSEVIGSFDIAEFYLDGAGNDLVGVMTSAEDSTFSRTLECLCVYREKLWVVCKETYQGNTYRVIKVVNPHSQWPLPLAQDQSIPMYLESIGEVSLSVTTSTADYLGVIDEDPDSLLIRIGGTYYKVEFEYDYFMFDADRRQVILRNAFTNGTLVTV